MWRMPVLWALGMALGPWGWVCCGVLARWRHGWRKAMGSINGLNRCPYFCALCFLGRMRAVGRLRSLHDRLAIVGAHIRRHYIRIASTQVELSVLVFCVEEPTRIRKKLEKELALGTLSLCFTNNNLDPK